MTDEQREKLQDLYIQQTIDDMDLKNLMAFAYDTINEDLMNYSNDELTELIDEFYPDLLK